MTRAVAYLCLLAFAVGYIGCAPVLIAEPGVLAKSGDTVTLVWAGVESPNSSDIIALYVPSDAPDADYIGYKSLSDSTTWAQGYGKLQFELVNMRVPVQFRLLNHAHTVMASSSSVTFQRNNEPLQGHLSLTHDPSEMRLMWVSASSSALPIVKFSHEASGIWKTINADETTTYNASDLCSIPDNNTYNFIHPGYIHTALLKSLALDSYYLYQYGSEEDLSEIHRFKTSPGVHASFDTHIVAYGDLGVKPPFDIRVEVQGPSLKTTNHVNEYIKKHDRGGKSVDLVLHIGDISYARGYAYLWEYFFHQIQTIATARPYMVCIGNHEYDWPTVGWRPTWGTYGTDSGGECGVPYNKRFSMAGSVANETQNLWYSFNYGNIHFVFISTEHDFLPGSPQYEWIDQDLSTVNRDHTPWVIFSGHRPMYTSSALGSSAEWTNIFQDTLEPLLIKYNVDLALWGHVHKYERTCKLNNNVCVPDGKPGPVHMVIGMAGNQYQVSWGNGGVGHNHQPDWSIFRTMQWGYITFHSNQTHMELSYWGDQENGLHDRFYLEKQGDSTRVIAYNKEE